MGVRYGPGRPRAYNRAVHGLICKDVGLGASVESAATAHGVGFSTVRRWLQDAREKGRESIYWAFWADLQRARAQRRGKAEIASGEQHPERWLAGPGSVIEDVDEAGAVVKDSGWDLRPTPITVDNRNLTLISLPEMLAQMNLPAGAHPLPERDTSGLAKIVADEMDAEIEALE